MGGIARLHIEDLLLPGMDHINLLGWLSLYKLAIQNLINFYDLSSEVTSE